LKFRIECKSLLLQKALEEFLKDFISEDGLVVSDENGDIIIGKDIKKPFSKSSLLIQLEKWIHKQNKEKEIELIDDTLDIDLSLFNDFIKEDTFDSKEEKSFEDKVDILIDEFSANLKKLIKEEYGKK